MAPTPITIITGFLGSGKTTLILNLIPQLPKSYKLALLKNEFGDLAVDSQLASSAAISGVQELLNGCICCNLVGQLSEALFQLRNDVQPSRIIIETSGSAFPATLAMEVNRVGRENPGTFVLDGVISVIDVENWKGYEDTSYTAKMQAKYTDLIVFNKWELVDEMAFEKCLDRVGDLEVQIAWVKSRKGWVDSDLVMGIDGAMVLQSGLLDGKKDHDEHEHEHSHDHQDEVDVLSVTISTEDDEAAGVELDEFEDLLLSAPKDEVYRIKGLIASSQPPPDSTGERRSSLSGDKYGVYVLNWAFSRWQYTPLEATSTSAMNGAAARLTFILARGEATKWKKKLEKVNLIEAGRNAVVKVEKIA